MPVGNTVAELVARLRADTGEFERGMSRAERKLGQFSSSSSKTMQAMAQMGQRFDQVAGGIALGSGVAIASLARVGVQYNTLMQKTTAAFNVLLGSASKSNEMIAELTEFAKQSPFPRQVFIEAAQQLIGFGMAARDVVPAFEAIQDAVAATGGGAAEIQQFTSIFANIKSMGRATTEDLMRFSSAGIDAFEMLAKQAGVSTVEMRKRITDGALGADEAIRMLTEGLTGKFEGAADEVKKTWIGAKDRIAGAWRDIGSKLMAPFVDPNGGGAAVKWANQIADLLRYLEREVITDLSESIEKMVYKWTLLTDDIDLTEWVEKGIDLFKEYGTTIKKLLPIVAGLSAGFATQGLSMLPVIGGMTNFLPLPGKLAGVLLGLMFSTDESRESLYKLGDTLKENFSDLVPKMIPLVEAFVEALTDLVPPVIEIMDLMVDSAFPVFTSIVMSLTQAFVGLLEGVRPIVQFLADHPTMISAVVAAYGAWKIQGLITDVGRFASSLRNLAAAQGLLNTANAVSGISTAVVSGPAITSAAHLNKINGNLANFNGTATRSSAILGGLRSAFSSGLLPVAALSVAFMAASKASQVASESATKFIEAATKDIDVTSIDGLRDGLEDIHQAMGQIDRGKFVEDDIGGFEGKIDGIVKGIDGAKRRIDSALHQDSLPSWMPSIGDASLGMGTKVYDWFKGDSGEERAMKQLEEQRAATTRSINSSKMAMSDWAKEAGVTVSVASELARVNEIDLTQGYHSTRDALKESWIETTKAGEQSKILIAASGLTAVGYKRQQEAFNEMQNDITPGMNNMMSISKESAQVAKRVSNDTIKAFEKSAVAIAAIPETYADTIAQVNQAIAGFLDVRNTWGEAEGAVLEEIQGKHDSFVEGLRTTYDREQTGLRATHENLMDSLREQWGKLDSEGRPAFEQWAETTKGVSTNFEQWAGDSKATFDEWSQHINGVNFDEFVTEFDQAGMAFTRFIDMQQQKLADLQAWQGNIREIAKKGGSELALELVKWGPQSASLVAEVASKSGDEFEQFKTLVLDTASASSDGLVMELGLMAELGRAGGADTVAAIAESLGLLPADVERIANTAKGDFGKVMIALAIVAKNGGRMSGSELTTELALALAEGEPEVKALIDTYIGDFERLGFAILSVNETIRDLVPKWREQGIRPGVINAELNANYADSANGNIFKAFAKGGFENHIAQIAPAGAMRLWAEPETGGEAYIPLAGGKRGRSMNILRQVADMFGASLIPKDAIGFSMGGITGSTGTEYMSASGGSNSNIDYDKLAAAISRSIGTPLVVHAQGTSAVEVADEMRAVLDWQHTGRGDF